MMPSRATSSRRSDLSARSSAANSGVERSRGWSSGTSITSLIRPGRVPMTTIRSARKTASEMLWVTKTTVFLSCCQIRSNSSCMTSRVWASSAPNGSSTRRTRAALAGAPALGTPSRPAPLTPASASTSGSYVLETDSTTIFGSTMGSGPPPALAAPAQEAALEPPEADVDAEADEPDDRRPQQHVGDQEEGARVVDQEAEPPVGRDELGGHDDEEGEAEAEAEAGDDAGRRGGQDDVPEDAPIARPEARGGADQDRVDVLDPLERGGEDRKERGVRDERDPRRLPDAEPEHHEGQERERRNRAQHLDRGIHQLLEHAPAPHRHPA